MKKFATIVTMLALVFSIVGCQSTGKISADNSENIAQNKEIALNLSRAIMKGDWKQVDGLIADDFFYIADGRPKIGKQQYIGFMQNVLSTAMTDMDMKFLRVVGEGNMVSVDYTNHMTNSGAFFGMPATGKRVIATGQFIREVKNGKITAEWQTTNGLGLMQQLGLIPAGK